MKRFLYALLVLVLLAAAGWWAMGPDWRRFLANPALDANVLFWSMEQRDAAFRMLDRVPIISRSNRIETGETVRPLEQGAPLPLDLDLDAYMASQRHAGLVILQDGQIRAEKYALGFTKDGRWTSFSVAKSFTSTLVGAALKDGHIESLDDPVSDYIEGLRGSAYDDVTIRQLLTMTSGVDWDEDYSDPQSDVALFNQHVPEDGLPALVSYMRKLGRAHPAGEVWNYSTGETNLIGVLVREATGKTLAEYLSEKVWVPYGMQQDATWLLSDDGQEISGCCIQAATRDYARFGQFILDGAMIDGEPIVPDDWFAQATTKQADIGAPGRGYGYQWWTYADGSFAGRGIFGQGIFIDPNRNLVIASNGNWTTALGNQDGENAAREAFYRAVQQAVDGE